MSMNAAARKRLFCLLMAEGVEHLTGGQLSASSPGNRSPFGVIPLWRAPSRVSVGARKMGRE